MLRRLGSFFLEIIQVVVFAVSIFLFIYLLILQPHKIKGASMEPNFHDGEYLLTDKVSYRFGDPERGDVIVFKAPPDFNEEFIKRIIGLPGDSIKVENGKVYLNGQERLEKFLPSEFRTNPGSFASEGREMTVPENQYLVFGDNRDHSFDSRNFGFISRDKITGKAWVIYWPPSEVGAIENPNN
jgi:signal peptidase I